MTDRYALVIGIAEYEAFPRLGKAASSALEVAHLLQKHGQFRVDLDPVSQWLDAETPKTMGTRLTGDELWQRLESFFQNTARGGDALFYFCGHGFVLRDRYNPNQQAAYLATSDTTITLENGQVINQNRGVSFQNLVNLFSQSSLRSLVVLLDCCHAGSLLEESVVETFLSNPNRDCAYRLIAACRASESAYESSQQYTIFTDALLKALAADRVDEEGQISDGRVWEFLRRELRGRVQKPVSISLRDPITLATYDRIGTPAPETAPVQPESPYIGLLAFQETEVDRFFGRDSASWDLLNDLRDNRFLAVVGDSGSGKSSLVKAGLLPKLRTGQSLPGSDQWQIEPMTPGHNPDVRLQAILNRHTGDHNRGDHTLLVLIDQFEEVFTQCDDEAEKRAFMQRITAAVTQPEGLIRFVITIRGDFLTRCGEYEIADLINASKPRGYIIKAMTPDELRDAIEKPAASHGVQFESHLVDQIIEEVDAQPGALPLLQHALKELWRLCIEEGQAPTPTLTWAAYKQIGGVAGALEKRADHLYASFSTAEQDFTRRLFVQELVKQEGQTYTRRRVTRSSLEKIAPSKALLDRVIDRFTGDRLLVTGSLPQTNKVQTPDQPNSFVEIAHEALLEKWTLLKTWLQEDREKIDLLQQLRTNFDNWNTRYQQSESALLMGALLANIEEKLDWKDLESEETEFVKKSLDRRDREVRFYRGATIGAIAAAVCITIIATLAGFQWRSADQGQLKALIASAKASFNTSRNSLDTLAEALRAGKQLQQSVWFRNDPQLRASVMEVLGQATYWVREHHRLQGHQQDIESVSFSPDGQLIATASYDDTAKLWTLDGKELHTLTGHTLPVEDIAFSPDGQTIATASKDKTIRLWTKDGKTAHPPLTGHTDKVWNVRFSPDGRFLASASADGTARLWDLNRNSVIQIAGHRGGVNDVSFSPDGKTVATASSDQTVRLWNTQGKLIRVLSGHNASVYSVNFSRDGQAIVSGSADRTAIIWQRNETNTPWTSTTTIEVTPLEGHKSDVKDAVFSPDSQTIATASVDSTVKLWNRKGILLETLQGHQGQVNGVNFNQDGTLLASASADKTVKLWKANDWLKILGGHRGTLQRVDFSPDGKAIAVVGDRGTARLWNLNHQIFVDLVGHNGPVYDVSFSPDNQLIATAGDDATARLWNRNGSPLGALKGHTQPVLGVSFDFSNQIVATASVDQSVKLWDRKSKSRIQTLKGYNTVVYSISFSRNGTIATSGFDGSIKLWSKDRKLLKEWQGHSKSIYSIHFSPDSQKIITASEDGNAKVWTLNGTLSKELKGHTAGVWDARFSPNGQTIATVSDDKTAKLWNSNGELILTLIGHDDGVHSLSFSPDSRTLVTASLDRTLLLWNLEDPTLESFMRRGCAWSRDYQKMAPEALKNVCN